VSKQRIIVTSAAPPNGNGYGTALAFDLDGHPLWARRRSFSALTTAAYITGAELVVDGGVARY
jgi:hypothetical protein